MTGAVVGSGRAHTDARSVAGYAGAGAKFRSPPGTSAMHCVPSQLTEPPVGF